MSDNKTPGRNPGRLARGLFEDIFLYTITAVIIVFTSWFLISTQNEITKNLPKADTEQIFLNAYPNQIDQTAEKMENDLSNGILSPPNAINRNYMAYLQAQSNLNKKRYDLGSQLVIANMTRKNIGFLIGTLLALLGCIIVVRRIRNMPLSASGNVSGQSFSLLTASPGVLLVVMGSIMIIATILRSDEVYVHDFDPVSPLITEGKKVDSNAKKEADDELNKLEQEAISAENSPSTKEIKK
jgi:hypothetical protein